MLILTMSENFEIERPVTTVEQAVVRLRLIGLMQASTIRNENVLPSGRKTRALLACIAMARRPVLRWRLAEQLWSRRSEDQARASLRQEIHRLADALSPAGSSILIVTREHLALRPGAVWTDVEEITQASSTSPAALSLLSADLLEDLDGIDPNFDAWLQAEREQLRSRSLRTAESMLHRVSDPEAAIEAAQSLLTIDRTHEGAWRALIQAQAARGERGLAIQAYNRCQAALAHGLDTEPSLETQRLFDEIRDPAHAPASLRPTQPCETAAQGLQTPVTDQAPENASVLTKHEPMLAKHGIQVGVMPFRLASLPYDVAYLAAGLADEITNALSRFRWMFVVSSNTLGRFAADNRDEAAIRREFGLDFLLDGSVQRAGGRVRISLRLLDLRMNNQIVWARRFDRDTDDLLSVQDEVAAEVAAQIDPEILLVEVKRSAIRGSIDPTAYDHILRAIPLFGRLEREAFMQAGQHLAHATSLEPDYAASYAWYAYWHMFLVGQGWADHPKAMMQKAGELAERAVVLDPFDARGLSISGHVRAFLHQQLQEAIALHERALSLNPNLAMAWALSAVTHAYAGDLEEAERRNNWYKKLSPLDPHAFFFDAFFVLIHLMKRDYNAAVETGRAVSLLNPAFIATYKPYLAALGHLRRDQEAAIVRRRLLALEPDFTIRRFLEMSPIEHDADTVHYAEGLRLAGIPE